MNLHVVLHMHRCHAIYNSLYTHSLSDAETEGYGSNLKYTAGFFKGKLEDYELDKVR